MSKEKDRINAVRNAAAELKKAKEDLDKAVKAGGIRAIDAARKAVSSKRENLASREVAARKEGFTDAQIDRVVRNPNTGIANKVAEERKNEREANAAKAMNIIAEREALRQAEIKRQQAESDRLAREREERRKKGKDDGGDSTWI